MSQDASRIGELLTTIAPYLDDVVATEDVASGVTVYRRGEREIARMDARSLEVRLPPDIAEAATRTPDAVAISGEQGWIRFTPTSAERHVADRAEAWFRTAWRHAGDEA